MPHRGNVPTTATAETRLERCLLKNDILFLKKNRRRGMRTRGPEATTCFAEWNTGSQTLQKAEPCTTSLENSSARFLYRGGTGCDVKDQQGDPCAHAKRFFSSRVERVRTMRNENFVRPLSNVLPIPLFRILKVGLK